MSQRGWAGVSRGRRFGMGSLWRVLSRRKTGWRDVDRCWLEMTTLPSSED